MGCAKNAVLPIMAASVLAPCETELLNVPSLRDVDATIRILRGLGARIHTEGRVAVVTGVTELHGAPTVATDLRGGAALIIAGLSAEGVTEILDSGHIERGYEDLDSRLRELGAEIERSA